MTIDLTVSAGVIAAMVLVGLFSLLMPVGLALFFWKRLRARWRFFGLGCFIFPVFALGLEQAAHALLLHGALGQAITGSLWLYALYGGLMAGLFEETGRLLAFRLAKGWKPGPQDALMYGAGHGGIEAVLIVGLSMAANIMLAMLLNQGGMAAVATVTGPLPEQTAAALQTLASTPVSMFFWSGFERLMAVGLHIALSVLVHAAVCQKGGWGWFAAAVGLHALVDMAAVLAGSLLPVAATEGLIALLTLGCVVLAWRVYHRPAAEKG